MKKVLVLLGLVAAIGLCWWLATKSARQTTTGTAAPKLPQAGSFAYHGELPREFHEAPVLTQQVRAGRLPPVKERLPDEPMVVPVVEKIGTYGGTWHRAFTGPTDYQNIDRLMHDLLLCFDLDGRTLLPNIAKSWETSEDGRVFTFHLRPGMKWSDGEPFTADDFVFAYEDIALNDEINSRKPDALRLRSLNGPSEFGRLEKVDDFTIRYVFPQPNYTFIDMAAGLTVGGQYARAWEFPPFAPGTTSSSFSPSTPGRKNWRCWPGRSRFPTGWFSSRKKPVRLKIPICPWWVRGAWRRP